MSKYLKQYIFLYKQLQDDELDYAIREQHEDEIDELYFSLDDDDLAYIVEKQLEM